MDRPRVAQDPLREGRASSPGLAELARIWIESGGGHVPVSGSSMRPTFDDASRVWTSPESSIRFGDIIVYTSEEMLVVHRVVGVRKAGQQTGVLLRTKGDGRPHLDPYLVPVTAILGRVIGIERGGRRYTLEGRGGRAYARLIGGASGLEGFLYRFAYRTDRTIGALFVRPFVRGAYNAAGPMLFRAVLGRMGRAGLSVLDRALFSRLNGEQPPAGMV